jgi:predicted RNase H-like HicB family nuclease
MATTRELLHLTPVFEQVEGGWVQAGLVELPGVITAAPSREEAQDMLLDALREFLLSLGDGAPATAAEDDTEGLTLIVSINGSSAA